MPSTILCTVGTSLLRQCKTLRAHQTHPREWDDSVDDLVTEIELLLQTQDLTQPAQRIAASAELANPRPSHVPVDPL